MLKIKPASQFKKDIKKFVHNKSVIHELDTVLKMLVRNQMLPAKYQDHALSGKWKGYRECHIKPDALLIYFIDTGFELLILERFGSHAELFKS